jgi:hypothetical protein
VERTKSAGTRLGSGPALGESMGQTMGENVLAEYGQRLAQPWENLWDIIWEKVCLLIMAYRLAHIREPILARGAVTGYFFC